MNEQLNQNNPREENKRERIRQQQRQAGWDDSDSPPSVSNSQMISDNNSQIASRYDGDLALNNIDNRELNVFHMAKQASIDN